MRIHFCIISFTLAFFSSCKRASIQSSQNTEFVRPGIQDEEKRTYPFSKAISLAGIRKEQILATTKLLDPESPATMLPEMRVVDVKFQNLTSDQKKQLASLYSGWSKQKTEVHMESMTELSLVDLLPPAFQAINNHRFMIQSAKLTADLPIVREHPHFRAFITNANCWGTVYELLQLAHTPANQGEVITSYTPFTTTGAVVDELLSSGEVIAERVGMNPDPDEFVNQVEEVEKTKASLRPGDALLFLNDTRNWGKPLLHVAIFVDDNLYFEKTSENSSSAFRLGDIRDIALLYSKSTSRLQWKRYANTSLKSIRDLHKDSSKSDALTTDLPGHPDLLVLKSENSLSLMPLHDIPILRGPEGRAILSKEAYEQSRFSSFPGR